MKSLPPMTASDRLLMRRLTLILSLSLFVTISLYVFVFAPLYVLVSSDVLYQVTVLPTLFDVLRTVADIAVFGIFYGVILYAVYRFSLRRSIRFLVIYGIGILYKNFGNLLMTFAVDGIPNDVLFLILSISVYILLEILQTALVVTLAQILISRMEKREAIRMQAAEKAHKTYTPLSEPFPFRKLLDFKNPVQKAAFWMAFVPMAVRVLSRLATDIFIAFPDTFPAILIDVLWMILYYSMDVLGFGVVVYFIMLFLLLSFRKADRKLMETESEASGLFS